MPDEAKLAKAREVGLRIGAVCGNCVYRQVGMGGVVGFCKLHSYMHQKHEGRRQMPAFRHFTCDDHELDEEQMKQEAGWYAGEGWRR